jgi:hypothetical protein
MPITLIKSNHFKHWPCKTPETLFHLNSELILNAIVETAAAIVKTLVIIHVVGFRVRFKSSKKVL